MPKYPSVNVIVVETPAQIVLVAAVAVPPTLGELTSIVKALEFCGEQLPLVITALNCIEGVAGNKAAVLKEVALKVVIAL